MICARIWAGQRPFLTARVRTLRAVCLSWVHGRWWLDRTLTCSFAALLVGNDGSSVRALNSCERLIARALSPTAQSRRTVSWETKRI